MFFNLNKYEKIIRFSFFILSSFPSIYLLYGYLYNALGINPFATFMYTSGHTAMVFIIITLSITPLRRWLTWFFSFFPALRWGKRLSDWNVLIKSRRMFGIYCFYYASIHLWAYCYLELDFYWPDIYEEIIDKRFIFLGVITWVLLLLLTVTSPKIVQKKMKKWWRRLHRSVYIIALLAVLHYYLSVKIVELIPIVYFGIIFILLFHRVLVSHVKSLRRKNDTGMENSR